MSIDFCVVCERPLPPDWAGGIVADGLPFAVHLETVEAWRARLEGRLPELAGRPWSFVLGFHGRPGAAAVTARCIETVLARFGGFAYDDDSGELPAVHRGFGDATGADLVARWREIAAEELRRERQTEEEAKRQWEEEAAKDPDAVADANDWSDV